MATTGSSAGTQAGRHPAKASRDSTILTTSATRRGAPEGSGDKVGSGDAPLREVAIRSGAYLVAREAVGMAIRLAGLVLVVRKIGPSDFGIYSAAAAYVFFAATLAQMGAEVFLIRMPGRISRRRYDEVFTFLLCSSALVVLVGLGLSYAVGPWLRPVGVAGPVRVLLFSVPINILWAPAQASIERRFAYRRMGALELVGDLALYGTAVPLALLGAGAWSLICGYFAWQGWLLVGGFVLSGLRPRLAWSWETTRGLLRHGRGYSLTTWIQGARTSIITMIVGTFAGAAGVGFVSFAQRLVVTFNIADRGVHRVGMVAISRAGKENPGRLSAALEEGSLLLMFVAAAPFAAFGLVAHWVVPDVFGVAWLPALPVYVLLALWAVLRSPSTVQRTLLYAFGENYPPAVTSILELFIVTVISIVTVRDIGIVGYGIASVVGVVTTANTHHAAKRLVSVRYRRLVVPLLGLVPPVLVPLLPVPWAYLLLLSPGLLFVYPTTRDELCHLASTARSTVRARAKRPRTLSVPAMVTASGLGMEVTAGIPREAAALPPPSVPPGGLVTGAPWGATSAQPARTTAEGSTDMGSNGKFPHPVDDASELAPFRVWRWDDERLLPPSEADDGTDSVPLESVAHDGEPASSAARRLPGPSSKGVDPSAAVDVPAVAAPGVASSVPAEPSTAPDRSPSTPRDVAPATVVDPLDLLVETDPATGLVSVGVLLARLGRILGSARGPGWSLVVAAVDISESGGAGAPTLPDELPARVAAVLRAELRFDDLVARVGPTTFVAAVPFVRGGSGGLEIVSHLESAVANVLTFPDHGGDATPSPSAACTRVVHLVVQLPSEAEADRLVYEVIDRVRR